MTPLKILSKDEEKILNLIPKFSYQEKAYFFKLPNSILLPINQESNKALLVLMFGYFKATNRFFEINLDDENLHYVKEYYHLGKIDYITNSPRTIQRYKRLIKSYLDIQPYTLDKENELQQEAINLANNFVHRKKILYSIIDFSKKLKIEIPSYPELLRIISMALNHQKKDMLKKLEPFLGNEQIQVLDTFLDKNSRYKNKYNIIQYKQLGHSSNRKQLLLSLEHFRIIKLVPSKKVWVNHQLNFLKPMINQ